MIEMREAIHAIKSRRRQINKNLALPMEKISPKKRWIN